MKSFPVLYTSRCTLSAVTPQDIPMLREILDDADTRRFLPELYEQFQTEERLQQFITSFDNYFIRDEGILWGIRLYKATSLIGFIAIMDMPDNPTLFYAMHSDYRNYGYMTEGLVCVIENVRETNLCDTLRTEVLHDNVMSQKLLNRVGFHQEKMYEKKAYYTRFIQ